MLVFKYKQYIIKYCYANYTAFLKGEVVDSDDSWLKLEKRL